jgi:DNA-binding NtrC family response regulator
MEKLIRDLRHSRALAKLIGNAPAFTQAIERLPAISKSGATVLISGETGTGKELVARAIHYLSARAERPFVPVNCGSLPDTLLEAELFGHERGAFTDARGRRLGLLAQAEGGTLFLDEADTLSTRAQVALLRFLQDKRYRTVGGACELQADVRVLAATNANLFDLVNMGAFRADLYHRLGIFTINLPPLRERLEDLPLLAEHLLAKHQPTALPAIQLTPAALTALAGYDWPGNVRELENALLRSIYLSETGLIQVEHLGLSRRAKPCCNAVASATSEALPPLQTRKKEVIEAFERDYLTRLMEQHHGNVSRAARTAGKERRELGKLLKKYQIHPQRFHPAKFSS